LRAAAVSWMQEQSIVDCERMAQMIAPWKRGLDSRAPAAVNGSD
jgi:hypothetical protein